MGASSEWDSEAIRQLAGDFRTIAEGFEGHVGTFSNGAAHIDEAFGLFDAARDMAAQYQSSLTEALEGLEAIVATVNGGADRIEATADNFDASEDASNPTGGGGQP